MRLRSNIFCILYSKFTNLIDLSLYQFKTVKFIDKNICNPPNSRKYGQVNGQPIY